MGWFFTSQHEKNVKFKQNQRNERIAALSAYKSALTANEKQLIALSVPELVKKVKEKEIAPRDLLLAFGKQALVAHEKTNCLTEVMISDAEGWADQANLNGPLAGIPISLKDPFIVKGYDALAGYSRYVNQPYKEDGAVTKLLRDAGGIPFVKTNVPITMMAIEGYNDIWGRTVNWHNANFAPGGSSQGEGSLIAGGGARIGIGSDIGGSVRVPAAWSGICSLKLCNWRWPALGDMSNGDGFEGVQANTSPMARTLPDLRYFIESVIGMEPWKYDFELVPIPWRDVELPKKPKVGVLTFPEFLPPTPAQKRALDTTADALRKQGCDVVDFQLPRPAEEYDTTISKLYYSDGFKHVTEPLLYGEHNDPYVSSIMRYVRIPKFIRVMWQGILRLLGFREKANMFAAEHTSSANEYIILTGNREKLREEFHDHWNKEGLDFLICPPHPSPAIPNYVPDSFRAVLYTSLFNLLDFPAGILPIGRVDGKLDMLPKSFKLKEMGHAARITFETYDSVKMDGLPIAVQVVCKRYEDEKTLKSMEFTFEALKNAGITYEY